MDLNELVTLAMKKLFSLLLHLNEEDDEYIEKINSLIFD